MCYISTNREGSHLFSCPGRERPGKKMISGVHAECVTLCRGKEISSGYQVRRLNLSVPMLIGGQDHMSVYMCKGGLW
jgi:hypothetical protein